MKLILLFIFFPCLIFSQTQIGQDINGVGAEDQAGWGLSLSADGTIVAVGADGYDGNDADSGHVRVFENINNVWTQIGQDIEGEFSQNNFGYQLSLSSDGSIVAIGSFATNMYGKVRIFENVNNVWTQIGLDIVGENYNSHFGESVNLSSDGNVVVIGADSTIENGNSATGHVLVYENINNNWIQKGQTLIGDGEYYRFGTNTSISSDGSIIAIAAPHGNVTNSELGYIRVYEYLNNSWIQLGTTFNASNFNAFIGTGLSLSSNGNIIAFSETVIDGTDSYFNQIKVFENINSNWALKGQVINESSSTLSLSSDGSILGLGNPSSDVNGYNSGQSKIYKFINDTWTQVGNNINGEVTYDLFGAVVSLSSNGSIIAISSPWNATNGTQSGQVRIYDLSLVLSSDNFVLSQFSLYPNPAKNQVTIK